MGTPYRLGSLNVRSLRMASMWIDAMIIQCSTIMISRFEVLFHLEKSKHLMWTIWFAFSLESKYG
jgi:hypothetical protein